MPLNEGILKRQTLTAALIDELKAQILSGSLAPGDMVPTNRELIEAFGVGRTTVREALQGLIASGLLEKRGNRLVIADQSQLSDSQVDIAALAARTSVRDVYETRKVVEVAIARLAAERATPEDLDSLRIPLEKMDPADTEGYHALNEEFHELLAMMCGNRVLSEMYLSNHHIFFKLPAYWRVFGNRSAGRRPFPGGGKAGHAQLYEAVASGDGERAAQVMFDHLDRVESRLVERISSSAHGTGRVPGKSEGVSKAPL